jgi:hypothetical protein
MGFKVLKAGKDPGQHLREIGTLKAAAVDAGSAAAAPVQEIPGLAAGMKVEEIITQ